MGGNNQSSVLKIDSQGSNTDGFQLGPDPESPDSTSSGARQGLTLVHFSAQREHFLSHVLGCFAGSSDENGSG